MAAATTWPATRSPRSVRLRCAVVARLGTVLDEHHLPDRPDRQCRICRQPVDSGGPRARRARSAQPGGDGRMAGAVDPHPCCGVPRNASRPVRVRTFLGAVAQCLRSLADLANLLVASLGVERAGRADPCVPGSQTSRTAGTGDCRLRPSCLQRVPSVVVPVGSGSGTPVGGLAAGHGKLVRALRRTRPAPVRIRKAHPRPRRCKA